MRGWILALGVALAAPLLAQDEPPLEVDPRFAAFFEMPGGWLSGGKTGFRFPWPMWMSASPGVLR